MTSTLKRPLLYGPNGKPLALEMYPSRRSRPQSYSPRPRLNRDMRKNVTGFHRCDMVNDSRLLFARLGNLAAAIVDKNSWAFGDAWEPHYIGANEEWGIEASAFLRDQFYPNCDRQGRYDWKTLLYLSGLAWDRDGDDLMVLTEEDNGSGFPKVEFFSSERIGNGDRTYPNSEKVIGGLYDGLNIYDGIIFDDTGRAVGVRVLGEPTEDGKEVYKDLSLGFGGTADLAYQPEWYDQGRGIPLIARCALDWMDLEDIDRFLKAGIKRASEVGLVSKTAEAEAGMGNEILTQVEEADSTGVNHTVTYEELAGDGGGIYYLRKDGESLEGLSYSSPHPNVENFIQRIERRGVKSVGWFYELMNLTESGRAAMRLVCDLANQSVWKQQSLGLKRTWRATRYALAKAQKNGFISRNRDPRDAYFSWDFGLPKPLSVDAGNDEQADRENLKLGTTSKAIVAQKKGYHWREVSRQRKAEIVALALDAEEIEASTGGKISFERAMELLEQRGSQLTPEAEPAPQPQDNQE